mmetsp:Transcript_13101/g.20577  ORF Transcript_13101/g.20577 Transcript_13101/m.20577 type:complete len:119 (-) Transcript_13101:483-839(-)
MSVMLRVTTALEFSAWAKDFCPSLWQEDCSLLKVPVVSDRTDARLCHLDGLLLSKAWSLRECAAVFEAAQEPPEFVRRLREAADSHYDSAQWLAGDYVGTHWLHSFALLALDDSQPSP